jgi:hypothetical protein
MTEGNLAVVVSTSNVRWDAMLIRSYRELRTASEKYWWKRSDDYGTRKGMIQFGERRIAWELS